jgi:hypothetical protein
MPLVHLLAWYMYMQGRQENLLPRLTLPLSVGLCIHIRKSSCADSILISLSNDEINTNIEISLLGKNVRSPPRLGWPLWNICVTNDHGYVPLVVETSRSFPRSWLITGIVTKLTWRMPLVEQQLLTLPEHLRSPPVVSRVRVTRALVLYVWFVCRCLSFYTISFGHCVVCSSSIYGFWLPLWYLQTLLNFYFTNRWVF